MKIILASASPRRRELLEQIGLEFEVRVSNVEEHITANEPGEIVEQLARQKAYAVLKEIMKDELRESMASRGDVSREDCLIIGADTVVAVDDRILGKPSDEFEAVQMLKTLSADTHQVYTGVAVVYYRGKAAKTEIRERLDGIIAKAAGAQTGNHMESKSFHERTDVTFYPMSNEEIAGYVASGDCMDKAGAYGIQGFCARYIQCIKGDYNNVVGLPVGRLYQEIKEWLV